MKYHNQIIFNFYNLMIIKYYLLIIRILLNNHQMVAMVSSVASVAMVVMVLHVVVAQQ
jgi:hypothetical protein